MEMYNIGVAFCGKMSVPSFLQEVDMGRDVNSMVILYAYLSPFKEGKWTRNHCRLIKMYKAS
jgi:hypothetical protein